MSLDEIRLRPGERVRFRRRVDERWHDASVLRRERDGSVGLRDDRGAARAITVDLIEVRVRGPRGGGGWEPLANRAGRATQLNLFPG